MATTLKDPAPQLLLEKLKKLLVLADTTFKDPDRFEYPASLFDIAKLVGDLQPYLGRKIANPAPFWKCVVALDKARPSLALIAKLKSLVKRATGIEPGPLVRLLTLRDQGELSPAEKEVLQKLVAHVDGLPCDPPQQLDQYQKLFAKVRSERFADLVKLLPPTRRTPEVQALMDHAAYLDFFWQHRSWRERYCEALEGLYGLLSALEHEDFFGRLNRLLHGEMPSKAGILGGRKRDGFTTRQRKRREKISPCPAGKKPRPWASRRRKRTIR